MDLGQIVDISVPLTTIFALAVIALLYLWLRKQDAGTERMQEIAHFIQMGANVFLRREFLTIAPFVVILALLLLVTMPEGNWQIALGFVGGATLAIFMFNAGGAWDNAKKYIEEGHFGGKGSEPHKASVIGDTFGDPLKDTAGPSLHILIKLQNVLAITLLPLFYAYGLHWH